VWEYTAEDFLAHGLTPHSTKKRQARPGSSLQSVKRAQQWKNLFSHAAGSIHFVQNSATAETHCPLCFAHTFFAFVFLPALLAVVSLAALTALPPDVSRECGWKAARREGNLVVDRVKASKRSWSMVSPCFWHASSQTERPAP
jgi:hypothetical protein